MIRSVIIFFLISTNTLFAEINKVNILGNTRINSMTIESLVDKKIKNSVSFSLVYSVHFQIDYAIISKLTYFQLILQLLLEIY